LENESAKEETEKKRSNSPESHKRVGLRITGNIEEKGSECQVERENLEGGYRRERKVGRRKKAK
jgi:hypothetical protein